MSSDMILMINGSIIVDPWLCFFFSVYAHIFNYFCHLQALLSLSTPRTSPPCPPLGSLCPVLAWPITPLWQELQPGPSLQEAPRTLSCSTHPHPPGGSMQHIFSTCSVTLFSGNYISPDFWSMKKLTTTTLWRSSKGLPQTEGLFKIYIHYYILCFF